MNRRMLIRSAVSAAVLMLLISTVFASSVFAVMESKETETAETDFKVPDTDMDFSFIKVLITTGNTSTVKLKLYGNYYIGSERISLNGTANSPYTLTLSVYNGEVYAQNSSGYTIAHGSTLHLDRVYLNYEGGYAKLFDCASSSTEGRNYLGNFIFSAYSSGYIRMVNDVPMAHYAYGIISYEMNTYFEPDALRAQAVAAKCYGMSYMSEDNVYYDTKDGFSGGSYQAYRGYREDRLSTMQYCTDVVGVAIAYDGRIIPTFYGATNGGETALPSHIFGGSQYDSAYSVVLDDVEFDNVGGRKDEIHVVYGSAPQDSRFKDFILCKIRDAYDYAPCEVISVDDMYCYDPVEGTERNMQSVYVKATVKYWDDSTAVKEINFPSSHLNTYALTDLDYSGNSYSSGSAVFTSNYEMYWGEDFGGGYDLYFVRHGHGIGLSQMGANVYADPLVMGWDYRRILNFYYPKFEFVEITEANPEIPLNTTLPIAAYAECNSDGVNFRVGPSTEYNSLGTVDAREHIDIISVQGNWYTAIWNGHFGYIYWSYVDIRMFPAPFNAVFTLKDGVTNGSASLRVAPNTDAARIEILASGTELTAWATLGGWYYVITSDGSCGFVSSSLVDISRTYEYMGVFIVNKTPKFINNSSLEENFLGRNQLILAP